MKSIQREVDVLYGGSPHQHVSRNCEANGIKMALRCGTGILIVKIGNIKTAGI